MDHQKLLTEARGLARRYEVLTTMDPSLTKEDLIQEAFLAGLEAARSGGSFAIQTISMRRQLLDRCRRVAFRGKHRFNAHTLDAIFDGVHAPPSVITAAVTERGIDVRRAAEQDEAFAALLMGWTAKMFQAEVGGTAWASAVRFRRARATATALQE